MHVHGAVALAREAVAEPCQLREMLAFHRTEMTECALLEFENQRGRENAIGLEEVEALAEH